jgi:hypothetical protein
MNDRDQLREDRLTRVQTFGREHAADFAAGSKGRTLLDRVDQHLLDLRDAKSGQTPARTSKATFLDALWLDFKDIARTARSIGAADLGGSTADYAVPEEFTEANIRTHADKLLRLLEDQPTDTAPQTAAKATLRGHFLAWEIASDFVEDLRADHDALLAANQHNQAENQEGVENTAAIGQILLAAGQDVENLNTIIRNKYSRQPEKLHTWQTASRIHRAPVRKKKAAPPPPPSGS